MNRLFIFIVVILLNSTFVFHAQATPSAYNPAAHKFLPLAKKQGLTPEQQRITPDEPKFFHLLPEHNMMSLARAKVLGLARARPPRYSKNPQPKPKKPVSSDEMTRIRANQILFLFAPAD